MKPLFRQEAIQHATRRLSGEVILATPLSVKTLGLLFATVVFAAAGFAATATYARKASVGGWLVPDQGVIRVPSQATGLVQNLFVKEGDVIDKGARIAEIDLSTEMTSGNMGEAIAKGLNAEHEAVEARGKANIERLDAEARQGNAKIVDLNKELEQVTKLGKLQESRIELARQDESRGQALAKKGLLTQPELNRRRNARLSAEQELAGQQQQIASLEKQIGEIKGRLKAIPIEMTAARAETETAQATLQQRAADAEAKRLYYVVAPISGRIAALPIFRGQTVSAGSSVVVMLPTGGKLEAELFVPSRAIGFVKTGQEVRLMLQAFPHQRFGTVPAEIKTVSSTVLGQSEISIPGLKIDEPMFRIRAALAREIMQAYGESIPMQPGMLVSADIVFDRRSLLRWLFDPIYAVGRR
jgi:membrane fusion protein